MKNMQLLLKGVDVSGLVQELHKKPFLWNQQKARLEQYAHNGLDDIWVRYNDFSNYNGDLAEFNNEHEAVWYPAYSALPQIKDIVFDVMRLVEGERLGGVLITRIPAGCTCQPHVDGGWHAEHFDKFALQIAAAEGQAFHFEEGSLETETGDLYWFNNQETHWVTNESDEDRITMIICIETNKGAK